MKITIQIDEAVAPQVMLSIAAANNWPRDVTADTVERLKTYMLKTVAQWSATGVEILTREATEAARIAEVSKNVTILSE